MVLESPPAGVERTIRLLPQNLAVEPDFARAVPRWLQANRTTFDEVPRLRVRVGSRRVDIVAAPAGLSLPTHATRTK
jgi:hypothetical protein